jgi:hypothetical protein
MIFLCGKKLIFSMIVGCSLDVCFSLKMGLLGQIQSTPMICVVKTLQMYVLFADYANLNEWFCNGGHFFS